MQPRKLQHLDTTSSPGRTAPPGRVTTACSQRCPDPSVCKRHQYEVSHGHKSDAWTEREATTCRSQPTEHNGGGMWPVGNECKNPPAATSRSLNSNCKHPECECVHPQGTPSMPNKITYPTQAVQWYPFAEQPRATPAGCSSRAWSTTRPHPPQRRPTAPPRQGPPRPPAPPSRPAPAPPDR
jgi:hypothetical protein